MAIDARELARRLRGAREDAGVTQERAAAVVGVSRPAIAGIEAGRRQVSGIELQALATLYGRDVRDLLGGDGVVAHLRADDLADLPGVGAALDECVRVGRAMAGLERLAGVAGATGGLVRYGLGPPPDLRAAIEQGVRTAGNERRHLGLGDRPIDDLIDLLEASGVRTALVDMPDGVSGVMLADPEAGPMVVANRSHHVLRRTFSLAHEYAHVLLDADDGRRVSREDGVRTDPREARANAFAAELLMPEMGVRRRLAQLGKDGRSTPSEPVRVHDLALLASTFGVSRPAMIVRLRTLGVIDRARADALRDEDARTGRAVAVALGVREPPHEWERDRFKRRYTHLVLEALGRGGIDRARAEAHLRDEVGLGDAEVAGLL